MSHSRDKKNKQMQMNNLDLADADANAENDADVIRVLDSSVANDDRDENADEEETDMIHIQGRIQLGERRKLIKSETELFERLNITSNPTLGQYEKRLFYMAEFLIIVSAVARFAIIFISEGSNSAGRENLVQLVENLGDPGAPGKSVKELRDLHVIMTVISSMILLPNLFLLGLFPEGRLSLFIQMVMSVAVIVITSFDVTTQTSLRERLSKNGTDKEYCKERKSCNHKDDVAYLYISILWFVATTIIRILFLTKLKSWLINLKCLGFYIKFLTSRRARDFVSLAMLLFLSFTIVSGSALHKRCVFHPILSTTLDPWRKAQIVFDAVTTILTISWLLLLFWIYSQVHHKFTHTLRVETKVLEEELRKLGERHQNTLVDHDVSIHGYCPMSRNPDFPVKSGQKVAGQVHEQGD